MTIHKCKEHNYWDIIIENKLLTNDQFNYEIKIRFCPFCGEKLKDKIDVLMKSKTILFCGICKKGKFEDKGKWMPFSVTMPFNMKEEKFRAWICDDCSFVPIGKIKGISIGGKMNNNIEFREVSLVSYPDIKKVNNNV